MTRSRTTGVIVHHSAGRDTATVGEIRAAHVARGFRDTGYHWIVRRHLVAGRPAVWTCEPGRPEAEVGSHDEGQNATTIGVCILGDYTRGPVPADAWCVLVATVADVCRRHGLAAASIEGHRENEPRATPTACPGFDPETLRRAVAEQLTRA